MRRPTKRKADAGASADRGSALQGNPNRRGHRGENQGLATQRAASQPAPTWPRPAGSDAADELQHALRQWGRT